MKFNFIQTFIAIVISLLISYGLYSFNDGENKLLLTLGSFAFLAITLISIIGVDYKYSRRTTNIRVVSIIFFVIALISNLIFSFLNFNVPSYIIINGVLFMLFILILYSINKVKQ